MKGRDDTLVGSKTLNLIALQHLVSYFTEICKIIWMITLRINRQKPPSYREVILSTFSKIHDEPVKNKR
jgi:hypothetical protein